MWQHFGNINNNQTTILNQTIMTVKELEAILCTVKNKDLQVCMNGYYVHEVNGYFYDTNDDKDVLMLTNQNVQPRIIPEV